MDIDTDFDLDSIVDAHAAEQWKPAPQRPPPISAVQGDDVVEGEGESNSSCLKRKQRRLRKITTEGEPEPLEVPRGLDDIIISDFPGFATFDDLEDLEYDVTVSKGASFFDEESSAAAGFYGLVLEKDEKHLDTPEGNEGNGVIRDHLKTLYKTIRLVRQRDEALQNARSGEEEMRAEKVLSARLREELRAAKEVQRKQALDLKNLKFDLENCRAERYLAKSQVEWWEKRAELVKNEAHYKVAKTMVNAHLAGKSAQWGSSLVDHFDEKLKAAKSLKDDLGVCPVGDGGIVPVGDVLVPDTVLATPAYRGKSLPFRPSGQSTEGGEGVESGQVED